MVGTFFFLYNNFKNNLKQINNNNRLINNQSIKINDSKSQKNILQHEYRNFINHQWIPLSHANLLDSGNFSRVYAMNNIIIMNNMNSQFKHNAYSLNKLYTADTMLRSCTRLVYTTCQTDY